MRNYYARFNFYIYYLKMKINIDIRSTIEINKEIRKIKKKNF